MSTQAAARPRAGQQKDEDEGILAKLLRAGQTVVLVYLVTSVIKNFTGGQNPKDTPKPAGPGAPSAVEPGQTDPFKLPPTSVSSLWPAGSILDMHVILSTSPYDPFSPSADAADKKLPKFLWENIQYGAWENERVREFEIDLPYSVQHNGSLWLHSFLTNGHADPNPYNPGFDGDNVYHFRKPLTRYLKKPKVIVEKRLLSAEHDEELEKKELEAQEPDVWLSYWHPNVTLTLVSDFPKFALNQLQGPLKPYVSIHPTQRDETGKAGFFYPIVFPNDFWLLRGQMSAINETTPTLPLRISFYPITNMKFTMFSAFSQGFDEAATKGGGVTSADLDEIKRMLIETSPWLLITTAIVSALHMLFEMLAFTSDVQHWRKRDELVGVSLRSILVNVFVQIITSLYLWDNAEETSWMILLTQFMGVAIEAWKITKAVNIAIIPAPPGSLLPYKLSITDKHVLSEDEKKTQEYDQLAFRYVSYVAIPVLVAYTGYSLAYSTHKGWYSFIISTLTSFVYAFGFVQLVPQLIINYKLKSVAHMPWKAMVYKTLSTVIDDFFAFIIKMPWLHRLACFRDDVVFLILLYQRWIYRVDPKRANEYGQVGIVEDEKDAKVVEGEDKKE